MATELLALVLFIFYPTIFHEAPYLPLSEILSHHRPLGVEQIVINEIMYSPAPGQTEWVELYNYGDEPVDLRDWRISDSDPTRIVPIVDKSTAVPPLGYALIAADSSIFDTYSLISVGAFIVSRMPRLNNDFDSVVLYDSDGIIVDSVSYHFSWGGGSDISLERINPRGNSNERDNWGSCVLPVGATPGQRNSIFTEVMPTNVTLTVSPNPFSPDGDGKDDVTIIAYRLPLTTATVNIKIYDVRGRLVRTLFNNELSGSSRSVIWDGRDNNGKILPIGVYIIYLEALNSLRGAVRTVKGTVVLARKL